MKKGKSVIIMVVLLYFFSTHLLAYEWNTETLSTVNDNYVYTSLSIAVDENCLPHLSYYDNTNGTLNYCTKTNSSWTTDVVDYFPGTFRVTSSWSSISLGTNNDPHIAYLNKSDDTLKYASLTNGSWESEVVDDDDNVGFDASLVIDNNGVPYIGYTHRPQSAPIELKYATKTNDLWSDASIKTVGNSGANVSLKLDHDGQMNIATTDLDNTIALTKGNGTNWDTQSIVQYATGMSGPSLGLNSSDYPYIAYYVFQQGISYAYWNGNEWNTTIIDDVSSSFSGVSIAFDKQDAPHFIYNINDIIQHAYLDGDLLKYETIGVGRLNKHSFTIDDNDNMHIVYHNPLTGEIHYAYGVIPEPCTLGLLALGGLAVVRRKR